MNKITISGWKCVQQVVVMLVMMNILRKCLKKSSFNKQNWILPIQEFQSKQERKFKFCKMGFSHLLARLVPPPPQKKYV